MSKLLHIAFNPAKEYSRTNKLAQAYLEKRIAKDSSLKIELLDLSEADLPPIDMLAEMARRKTFGGVRYEADEETVWERVTRYCAQFVGADEIVLSCAMWNFSIPYKVKHYIDVIVQPKQTFAYTEQGLLGREEAGGGNPQEQGPWSPPVEAHTKSRHLTSLTFNPTICARFAVLSAVPITKSLPRGWIWSVRTARKTF